MKNLDRIIVFDTETTGLTLHPSAPLAKQPKIIEFGAIILEQGEVIEEFSTLINPQESLSEEIVKITGLTDAQLSEALPFKEYLPKLTKLFNKCGGMAAHNLPFDKTMLMNELKRCDAAQTFPWPVMEMCTVGVYKEQWGRNPRLQELYADVIGKPLNQTHRAMDDVKALVEIIQEEELWALA